MKKSKKLDLIFYHGFSFVPLIIVFTILLFYFHARIILGNFPTYANPDPKDLGIYTFYGTIINSFFILSVFILPIWFTASIIKVTETKFSACSKQFLIFTVGLIAMYCLSTTSILTWFLD